MNANLLRLIYIIAAVGLAVYALDSCKRTAAGFKPLEGADIYLNDVKAIDIDNGGGNGG